MPTKVRWLIFALCCAASWFLYLHRYTWSVIVGDLETEFGWSKQTIGGLAGIFNLTYALGQVPSGMICDWFGPYLFLSTAIVGWSLGLGLTTAAWNVPTMYTARLAFGLAQAGCYPALNKMTKSWFPRSTRTGVQGWIASFFGRAGGACSTILLGTLLVAHLGLGWRQATWVLVAAGIVFGAIFLVLARNAPAEHPWSNLAEARLVIADEVDSAPSPTGERAPLLYALTNRNYLIFLAQFFFCVFPDLVYTYWIPTFLREARGMDLASAGVYASLPLIGGALGGSFAGMAQDWLIRVTGNRRWSRGGMAAMGNLVAGGLMLASLRVEDGRLVMVALGFSKFFADWNQPTCWATVTDISGRFAGTTFGIMNMVGSLAGTLSPPFMGWVVERFGDHGRDPTAGWFALFAILACFYFVTALSWLVVRCDRPIRFAH